MQRVRKAIIPAAGLGTRFLPATKAVPKEMLPIIDVPTIQLVVEEAIDSGIEEIILVTGRGKSAIEDHFDTSPELEHTLAKRADWELHAAVQRVSKLTRLTVVRQKQPLGLGHAIRVARGAANDEPVAVLLGDDLFFPGAAGRPALAQLLGAYESGYGEAVVALLEVPVGDEHKYGIVSGPCIGPGRFRCDDLVEKPALGTAPSRMAIVGRYVLPPAIWPILEQTQPGRGGEIQLTDALKTLAHGVGVVGMTVDARRHDAGDKLGMIGAWLDAALARPDLRRGTLRLIEELAARQRHAA